MYYIVIPKTLAISLSKFTLTLLLVHTRWKKVQLSDLCNHLSTANYTVHPSFPPAILIKTTHWQISKTKNRRPFSFTFSKHNFWLEEPSCEKQHTALWAWKPLSLSPCCFNCTPTFPLFFFPPPPPSSFSHCIPTVWQLTWSLGLMKLVKVLWNYIYIYMLCAFCKFRETTTANKWQNYDSPDGLVFGFWLVLGFNFYIFLYIFYWLRVTS